MDGEVYLFADERVISDEEYGALEAIAALAEKQTTEWERYNSPEILPIPVKEMRALLNALRVAREGA